MSDKDKPSHVIVSKVVNEQMNEVLSDVVSSLARLLDEWSTINEDETNCDGKDTDDDSG